jgi:hypothetical protein
MIIPLCFCCVRSWDSSVGIVMGCGLDAWVRFLALQDFSLLHSIQTNSGGHPASYLMGSRGSFLAVKRQGCESDHSFPSSAEIFPPCWLEFEPRTHHVGFVVDKVALGQFLSEYLGFPCQLSFHRLLHTHHHHLSFGVGTVGQIVADIPNGFSLIPPQESN